MLLEAEVEEGVVGVLLRNLGFGQRDEQEVGRVGTEGDSETTTKVSLELFFC